MKLLEYMKKKGITIAFLARNMGYTREYVSRILNGRQKETKEFLEKIKVLMGNYDEV